MSVTKIHGKDKHDYLKSWLIKGGVAVTTYETLQLLRLNSDFKFSLLIVDEAHYVKNPEAQRTVNVKKICKQADRLLFMTGTALENRVEEMVDIISILQPNAAKQIRGMDSITTAHNFKNKISEVYYRRKREDVLIELPELIEYREWCKLSLKEEQLYVNAILEKNYSEARRLSWNVKNLEESSKAKRMLEIISDAKGDGRKIIIFTFFLKTIDSIKEILGDQCLPPIKGSVTPTKRQEIIDEFDRSSAGTVLLSQIISGGVGLNIQSASVVIICEPQFKPSTENQAISRAYRMGQLRNVLVYRLLCENTIDEKITNLLESKQRIFNEFADEAIAAKKEFEIDNSSFGTLIQEEINRINIMLKS